MDLSISACGTGKQWQGASPVNHGSKTGFNQSQTSDSVCRGRHWAGLLVPGSHRDVVADLLGSTLAMGWTVTCGVKDKMGGHRKKYWEGTSGHGAFLGILRKTLCMVAGKNGF